MDRSLSLKRIFKIPLILGFLTLLTTPVSAKLRKLDSTRLISTSGAGIGAILLNESAFLNPASIYFFQDSSFYYQKGSASLNEESDKRESAYSDDTNEAVVITDTSSVLKGSFSYQYQKDNGERRTRLTSSASTHISKNASFGVLYRYTQDSADSGHKTFHQAVFGITYVVDPRLTFGAILEDPFLANKEDTKLAGGFQYALTQNFLVLGDIGSKYNDEPEENNFWRAAAQAQFFTRFYLKYGMFEDKIDNLHGNSWGLSWVGPKLSFEYAYRKSKAFDDSENFYDEEEIEEHSLALSLVF